MTWLEDKAPHSWDAMQAHDIWQGWPHRTAKKIHTACPKKFTEQKGN